MSEKTKRKISMPNIKKNARAKTNKQKLNSPQRNRSIKGNGEVSTSNIIECKRSKSVNTENKRLSSNVKLSNNQRFDTENLLQSAPTETKTTTRQTRSRLVKTQNSRKHTTSEVSTCNIIEYKLTKSVATENKQSNVKLSNSQGFITEKFLQSAPTKPTTRQTRSLLVETQNFSRKTITSEVLTSNVIKCAPTETKSTSKQTRRLVKPKNCSKKNTTSPTTSTKQLDNNVGTRSENSTIRNSSELPTKVLNLDRKLSNNKRKKTPQKSEITNKKHLKLNSYTKENSFSSFISRNVSKKSSQKVSSESFESTFINTLKNTKTKLTTTKKEQKALFKRYGVILPTIEEIYKERENLKKSKAALENFYPLSEDSIEEVSFIDNKQKKVKETMLDCKHLTLNTLSQLFEKNLKYLSDIIDGKIKNDRHDRYFNKNKTITFTTNDLTYNTSMILFNFQQIEHLLELLKKNFDPDDSKTEYFFQVLLPEICLKIFRDTHKMKPEQAVQYLNKLV